MARARWQGTLFHDMPRAIPETSKRHRVCVRACTAGRKRQGTESERAHALVVGVVGVEHPDPEANDMSEWKLTICLRRSSGLDRYLRVRMVADACGSRQAAGGSGQDTHCMSDKPQANERETPRPSPILQLEDARHRVARARANAVCGSHRRLCRTTLRLHWHRGERRTRWSGLPAMSPPGALPPPAEAPLAQPQPPAPYPWCLRCSPARPQAPQPRGSRAPHATAHRGTAARRLAAAYTTASTAPGGPRRERHRRRWRCVLQQPLGGTPLSALCPASTSMRYSLRRGVLPTAPRKRPGLDAGRDRRLQPATAGLCGAWHRQTRRPQSPRARPPRGSSARASSPFTRCHHLANCRSGAQNQLYTARQHRRNNQQVRTLRGRPRTPTHHDGE